MVALAAEAIDVFPLSTLKCVQPTSNSSIALSRSSVRACPAKYLLSFYLHTTESSVTYPVNNKLSSHVVCRVFPWAFSDPQPAPVIFCFQQRMFPPLLACCSECCFRPAVGVVKLRNG